MLLGEKEQTRVSPLLVVVEDVGRFCHVVEANVWRL